MKMFRTRLMVSMIALATTLFVSSCSSDDEGPSNWLTIDGSKKALKVGLLNLDDNDYEDGSGNMVYHHELVVVSEEPTVTTGIAHAIDIFMVASSSPTELSAGTYEFSDEEACDKLHFSLGNAYIDYNIATQSGPDYELLSGTLTVAKSGDNYTIDFDGTAAIDGVVANSKSLKFHFAGPFTIGEK